MCRDQRDLCVSSLITTLYSNWMVTVVMSDYIYGVISNIMI